MKAFILVAALAASVLTLSFVCTNHVVRGNGKMTTAHPDVTSFDAIEIAFPMKAGISVQDGATASVQYDGDENILSYIKTKVRNHTLVIYCDDNLSFRDGSDVTANIKIPAITALSLSSSERAIISGNIKSPKFKLDISGSGSTSIENLNVADFESDISGSGSIDVNGGSVNKAQYEISGSGRVRAYPLQANEVYASISGSGKTEVSATQKLSIDISGSGTIRYKGRPDIVKQDISGSGSLLHED